MGNPKKVNHVIALFPDMDKLITTADREGNNAILTFYSKKVAEEYINKVLSMTTHSGNFVALKINGIAGLVDIVGTSGAIQRFCIIEKKRSKGTFDSEFHSFSDYLPGSGGLIVWFKKLFN